MIVPKFPPLSFQKIRIAAHDSPRSRTVYKRLSVTADVTIAPGINKVFELVYVLADITHRVHSHAVSGYDRT